jgi:hypothetical protein
MDDGVDLDVKWMVGVESGFGVGLFVERELTEPLMIEQFHNFEG